MKKIPNEYKIQAAEKLEASLRLVFLFAYVRNMLRPLPID